MAKNIAIYKASIDNEELNQIRSVLESKNDLSKVLEFEDNMKKFIGAKYAIATATSTAAIHLALSAIKLKRGDKILMSVNSFVNLPEVVRHFDAEPIFIDINMEDMNIDINKDDKISYSEFIILNSIFCSCHIRIQNFFRAPTFFIAKQMIVRISTIS